MTIHSLPQDEADALIAMEKRRTSSDPYNYPTGGESLHVPLESVDEKEAFTLILNRRTVSLSKITYITRARKTIVLIRLDLDGRPHRNPDDVEVPCPHIHVYQEGYDDKWAYPVDPSQFSDITNPVAALVDFMTLCHITEQPVIRSVLAI